MSEEKNREEISVVENAFGRPPGWLINNGITLIFCFLAIMLIISYFVKYPDTLQMQAIIHTENAPIDVLSKQSGLIESIFVKHNEKVDSGALMVVIASPLVQKDLEEIQNLIVQLDKITQPDDLKEIFLNKDLRLGSITESYLAMAKVFDEFNHFLSITETSDNISALTKEIGQTNKLVHSLESQELTYIEAMALNEKDLNRSIFLQKEGVLADVDVEISQAKILQDRIQKENYSTGKVNHTVRIQQLKTQIQSLVSKRNTDLSNRMFDLKQSIAQLKNEIIKWEDIYVIKAPKSGIISFTRYWSKDQWLRTGDTLGTINVTSSDQNMVLEGYLPISNSGKVTIGQSAQIEVANFPSNEFGVLKAKVVEMSFLPTRNSYLIRLELVNGLNTTYNKTLDAKQNMATMVIIETKEYSLLERFFQGLSDIMKNR